MNRSEFVPANNFMQLANIGRHVVNPSGIWFPASSEREDALSFARYVGGFARRVLQNATTRSSYQWSSKQAAYLAELSIQVPDWGGETGPILCVEDQAFGIGVRFNGKGFAFPIKPHRYVICSRTGSRYICFTDGTAFCRSFSEGPQYLGRALYFASSWTDADHVQNHGGGLQVVSEPAVGLYPLYVLGNMPTAQPSGGFLFEKDSFRLGTAVRHVTLA